MTHQRNHVALGPAQGQRLHAVKVARLGQIGRRRWRQQLHGEHDGQHAGGQHHPGIAVTGEHTPQRETFNVGKAETWRQNSTTPVGLIN